MRSVEEKFYKNSAWENCRAAYLQTVQGNCERCIKKGILEPAKIVHHKIHLNEANVNDPEVAYGFENLEALCLDCHNKEHFEKKTSKRWKFVNGELRVLE